ncbi:hypothetical protein EV121DRAFT_254436 [Schizophyllum commune]
MNTLPSSSGSLEIHQNTRKRQRSRSMESDSSETSAKRAQSEGPSQPCMTATDDATFTSPAVNGGTTDPEIDGAPPQNGPLGATAESSERAAATSPQEKLATIEAEMQKPMAAGDEYYLVDANWYQRWRRAVTGEVDKAGPVEEKDLAPVSAQSLVDSATGKLRPGLVEHEDVEYLTPVAYAQFVQWYGQPNATPPTRRVILRGERGEPSLELYPPSITVSSMSKLRSLNARPPHELSVSSTTTLRDLREAALRRVSQTDPTTTTYRVWRLDSVPAGKKICIEFSAHDVSSCDGKLVEASDRTVEEEGLEDAKLVVELQEGGSWLVEEEKNESEGMFSQGGFFDKYSAQSSSSSSLMKPKTTLGPFTRASTSSKPAREPGTTGLTNLGNTCFMNSALQCLAHQEELTEYFLSGVFKQELNPDNPLGMHGAIAEAFGDLLQHIWARSSASSYSPRDFKMQLQRFAPQFSGYQQHDSQELVAFLLDGLHEDLNRVLKKPYVEKPDWGGGGDLELAQLAKKSWDGYMLRNDSVIVDLFQGQYQSTLVCPECQKVSITFDPFMYLTLPLPIQSKWKHTIIYVPYDSDKPHLRVPMEISSNSSFRDVRTIIGRWMGVPPDNLLTMELFNHKFYKSLDDHTPVTDTSTGDIVVCFELPCKGPQARGYKYEEGDPFILPLILNCPDGRSRSEFGYPMPFAIKPEDARSMETIYASIVDRLARWTKNRRDLYSWELGMTGEGGFEEVPLKLKGGPDKVTEITATEGEVVVHEEQIDDEETDIADEKKMIVDDQYHPLATPVKTGVKKDIFSITYAPKQKSFGTAWISASSFLPLQSRADDGEEVLLHPEDTLHVDFDTNMKEYYFGEGCVTWEEMQDFSHPEIDAAREESRKPRGPITLQDCLDEFTKEEQLGEDDLWYCPQCKKHQQATKRFDLWKTPDILVVHLKRFSNSRALRDKIDAFVDFPIEGLDLAGMAGERKVANRLKEEGVDASELNLGNTDEPLLYDLFAVDEHMGGLGGGHYRAYALNHETEKWYHFDDSFVTEAEAKDSVNSNAYLLFYRRRSDKPLGGKTHTKIEEARLQSQSSEQLDDDTMNVDTQLPTPPEEDSPFFEQDSSVTLSQVNHSKWRAIPSPAYSDPPPLLDEPPEFGSHTLDPVITGPHFQFPNPENVGGPISPSSSTGVEHDSDEANAGDLEDEADLWRPDKWSDTSHLNRANSPEASISMADSPASSSNSDNPFSDANRQGGGLEL